MKPRNFSTRKKMRQHSALTRLERQGIAGYDQRAREAATLALAVGEYRAKPFPPKDIRIRNKKKAK